MRLEGIAASWVYDEPLQCVAYMIYSVVDVGMLFDLSLSLIMNYEMTKFIYCGSRDD